MKLTDNWFTAISQGEDGAMVFVTGRKDLEAFRSSGSLKVRVEICWPYTADAVGMPDGEDAALIAEVEPLLRRTMERDKLAIMTGNYTGSGRKYWVWYTRHLPTFGTRLNECLEPYRTLPLEIHCEEDPDWDEYLDMLSMDTAEVEDLP